MKTINRILATGIAAGALLGATQALADDYRDNTYRDHTSDLFRENELTLDLFGSLSVSDDTIDNISGDRIENDGRLGAGAGLNYFVTRNLGVGVDAYTENTQHSFVDSAAANLILRFPIGESGFAPYVFAGGVRQFDRVRQWGVDAGGGLEFRFDRQFSLFADARYVFADKTDDYGVGRAGVRISF